LKTKYHALTKGQDVFQPFIRPEKVLTTWFF